MLAQSWGDTRDNTEMHDIMTAFVETGVHLSRPRRAVDPNDPSRTI